MKKYKRFLAFFMVWSMLLSLPVYADGQEMGIAAASLDSDIGCDVNLMYDGMYYENAMIKNKQLSVPVKLTNTGSQSREIACYVVEYDADGNLLDGIEVEQMTVPARQTVTTTLTNDFHTDAETAKILVWDNAALKPIIPAIILHETEQDYYANDFSQAQEYDLAYTVKGNITPAGDVDFIKFVPESSGEYTFNCVSANGNVTTLYNASQSSLKANATSYQYSLTAGQAYYLKIHSDSNTGSYILSVQHDVPIEAEDFDIYEFDVDTNIYKKSIQEICDELYNDNPELSKQMYAEYEDILSDDAALHALPDFLAGHPKDLDNFDELLNQYYATRYYEFAAIRERYIDLIDQYSEVAEETVSAENDAEGKENIKFAMMETFPKPIVRATSVPDDGQQGDTVQQEPATPSFTIVSTTPTSITYDVTFPVSGQWGNTISMVDVNCPDGIAVLKYPYGDDVNRTNGRYTLSNLEYGGIYVLYAMWSTDGETYGGDNVIDRFVQLPDDTPETLTLYSGGRVTARMEAEDKELASSADFNLWLDRMDMAYNTFKELTGNTPYDSKKIEMRSTRENLNEYMGVEDGNGNGTVVMGYATDSNVFRLGRVYYRGHMRRLSQDDWGETAMHEMSHVFDHDNWIFDWETLAQFKLYYVMEQLDAKIYRLNHYNNSSEGWYTGDTYYDLMRHDSTINSYDETFGQGFYDPDAFAVILIDIQREIGWEPYKKTFRYLSSLSKDQVPNSDGEVLKLFLTKLKDFSGEDVLSYINARDTGIIEDEYGVDLEYVEPVYPSIPGGGSSGGGHSEINADKGTYTTFTFTPEDSGNYYIYTSPYGGSGVSNDTYIEVYDNASLSGTPIASNDDYDGGRFSKVSVAMTEGTTYYIKVRHYSNGQLHAELNITKNVPVQPLESGGYEDIITANGEFSMFSFTPEFSGTYIFEAGNYNGGSSSYDTYLKLYANESMTQRIGHNATKVVANLQEGHTYYLQFSGYLMKYARARIYVRQGQTLSFTKRTDSNFIYVNSPEYLTRIDIVDDACHTEAISEQIGVQPYLKIFEQENVTGQNTFYETHLAWWGRGGTENYFPLSDFYLDVDLYNPTASPISVTVENLAYGADYSILQQYYNGGYGFDVTIEPYSHVPLLSHIGAPLLCEELEAGEWMRTPVILFDFTVHSGNVTVSSLAAYNPDNLYLRDGTKNIVDATGAELDRGEIIYEMGDDGNPAWDNAPYDPRPNETDLYIKMKGIARNESAWIDANIDLAIDDNTSYGTVVPIHLQDDYYTYGIANPKRSWKSSINPLHDRWDGVLMMLPSGLHNFKYHFKDTNRQWYFDFAHRDLRYIDETGSGPVNHAVPEQIIEDAKRDMAAGQKNHFGSDEAPDAYAMSMGEWGATYHYTVTVTNTSSRDRTVNVQTWAAENLIFGVKEPGASSYTTAYYQRISNTPNAPETTASVTIPANTTSSFEFVTMLAAGVSGLNHAIVVS